MSSVLSAEVPLSDDSRTLPVSGEIENLDNMRDQKREQEYQQTLKNCEQWSKNSYDPVLVEFFRRFDDDSTVFGSIGLPDWVKKGYSIIHQVNTFGDTGVIPDSETYYRVYEFIVSSWERKRGFENFRKLMEDFLSKHEILADAIYIYSKLHASPRQPDPSRHVICGAALAQLAWEYVNYDYCYGSDYNPTIVTAY